jgi:cytochrome P450
VQGVGFWTRPLPFLERARARYGKRWTLRLPGTPPFVILSDPDEIKEVFTAPPDVLHPGEGARVLEPLVGSNSVILLDEAPHMEQRKLMLPAFHGERMEGLAGLMTDVTEREIASWPREQAAALHPRMQKLTLEIILRAVFGLQEGARLDALRERLRAVLEFGDNPMSLLPPPPRDGLVWRMLMHYEPAARFFRLQEEADALMFELIDERRRSGEEGDDVLSTFLQARHEDGSPMSDQELRDELVTMLVAGHETTATTLAWTFERLTREPAVLSRLQQELDSDPESPYLTATIQEAMRRRPVLPNSEPRQVVKEIDVGGWNYQPGPALVPNAYLVHHDPDIYPDPYAFKPERFIDEPPGTYTWIPFGGGRRRCIGASFAMAEMKIVMRSVLQACELRTVDDRPETALRRNITIRPAAGAKVVVRARKPVEVASV